MNRTWRDAARSAIAKATTEGRKMGLEGKALEKHVRAAYPFGERAMYPYKVWLDELNRQFRGTKKKDGKIVATGPKMLGEWPGLTEKQREALGM
jgi:hypothetical protein